jgi:hypothetical protein
MQQYCSQGPLLWADPLCPPHPSQARIEQAGGYVWWDRVMGELAVSRAIGDHCLRPFVIAVPEVGGWIDDLAGQEACAVHVVARGSSWECIRTAV